MMEVALHIPDDVAKQMRQVNGQDIARHILEEYAIRAYQERTLGESHLRRLLGFETRDELEEFFAAHHVYRNYTLEDLEKDRRTAQQLGL
jgi:Uncharacterised protein family (UPF0175)